ncbi:acetolactate decarboxylase [Methylogaea oryzae]|uniref:Alpha-acetolactate decarboxylase n=1 Tax=Methylogaea oryzae TaxID=1295382 RepID=A0A8D4VLB4_9GAMM|nr:acetolactate decarboxylase [Methylogaea oryzae]BBL70223.1 acetolactate decarboxylase [Methylogaea oryzae]
MNNNKIYLCAPVNALVEGIYEEKIPFTEIKKHGDFGLGTFDNLDGEMIMLDGNIYQMTADGRVHQVDENALTPFACVTFYQPLTHDELEEEMDYPAFLQWLQNLLPSPNIFYAIRIEGLFNYVKVRSVPKQENYRPLVDVAEEQPVFEFSQIEGTLAGFFTPSYMSSLSVPGLHLHFLSADLQHGGHLMNCRPVKIRAGIQCVSTLEMALPMSLDYLTWDFRRNTAQDLDKAEK